MIGIWEAYSNPYLYVAGLAMLAAFGVPLIVAPLSWARALRWEVPQPEHLAAFLGRSVGVLISVLAVSAFMVTGHPQAKPFFFDLMLWVLAAMLALHVYGAIRKTQPITETMEIGLWIVLFLTTLCFHPV